MGIIERAAEVITGRYSSFDPISAAGIAQALSDARLLASEPRVITTAEELDALPGGAAVLDDTGSVWQRTDRGQWYWAGSPIWAGAEELALSSDLTVLYVPEVSR